MNTKSSPIMDAFAESVEAAKSGDADRIASTKSHWREIAPAPVITEADRFDDYESLWEDRYGMPPWWH